MKNFKVLVAGASGFVGRNLVEHLAAAGKYEIFACTDPVADLCDPDAVKRVVGEFGPDCVVNCAAVGGTRKTGYDQGASDVTAVNLRMFFNLARALPAGARMLQLGSGAEYDFRAYQPKMSEEFFDTSVPADPYGFSKYVMSKYAAGTDNITVLRIFGIYGKYEDYTFKFISNAIVKNLLGLPIVINRNVKFDYLWIGDFCAVVERFLGKKPLHTHYNITPAESTDLLSLAKIINTVGEKESEIKVLTPGMNTEYTGSNLRMLKEQRDFNFTSYENGIKQLYAYYAARLGELDLKTVKADPFLKLCKTTEGGAAKL